jgi:hypothetical protein
MTIQELFDYPYLNNIFLELIKPEYGNYFKNRFKEIAPIIAEDIESASTNSQCSCTQKVISYLNLYTTNSLDFLINFINTDNDNLTLFNKAKTAIEKSNQTFLNYSGKIAKTSIAEWGNFCNIVNKENGYFRGISVVKDGDDVLVFFL